jgi:hypothetical protein
MLLTLLPSLPGEARIEEQCAKRCSAVNRLHAR